MNKQLVIADQLLAKLAEARRLADRFNIDFEQILNRELRKLPADSVRTICAKLNLPYNEAPGTQDQRPVRPRRRA